MQRCYRASCRTTCCKEDTGRVSFLRHPARTYLDHTLRVVDTTITDEVSSPHSDNMWDPPAGVLNAVSEWRFVLAKLVQPVVVLVAVVRAVEAAGVEGHFVETALESRVAMRMVATARVRDKNLLRQGAGGRRVHGRCIVLVNAVLEWVSSGKGMCWEPCECKQMTYLGRALKSCKGVHGCAAPYDDLEAGYRGAFAAVLVWEGERRGM